MSHYDETAEKAILGVAVLDPRVTTLVPAGAFDHWAHRELWQAITDAHAAQLKPEPATIMPRLNSGHVAPIMQLMTEVVGLGIASNVDAYAATITDRAERRRVASVLDGIRARLDNPDVPAGDTLAWAETNLVGGGSEMDHIAASVLTLEEFVGQELPDLEWVIPGLLAAGERLVLTGVEGFGKSICMRQIGVAAAAGLDPFSLASTPPKKVLLVDCENPARIMIDKLGDLLSVVRRRRSTTAQRMWIKRYPQGLDLADPKDRLKLHHLCQMIRPDLLLIGPAYKLYVGGSNAREEDLARQVTSVLDGLREEFGFALVLEHHSPHGHAGENRSVRPIGSSLWLRWPEFGLGLRPQDGTKPPDRKADLIPWRGARDERPWPKRLEAGAPGELPWVDPARLRNYRQEAS